MAYNAGMIGMIVAGGFGGVGGSTTSGVAPFGGAQGGLRHQPLLLRHAGGEEAPVMVDFATSAVAGGKISLARAKGEQVPPGCILDKEGNARPLTRGLLQRRMLPTFGAHKGYGLAVVAELLGQAFTGSDRYAGENGAEGPTPRADRSS